MMKSALAAAVLILSVQTVTNATDPKFTLVDLGADERLLFLSTTEQPGWGSFDTLFEADLKNDDELTALTHFPERSRYFPLSGELEIQNRYGLYRSSVGPVPELRELDFFPSFTRGSEITRGRVLPVSSSPDGKWVLVQEPVSSIRGNLVLYGSSDGTGRLISSGHVLDYRSGPGTWSPDSRYLLYSVEDTLYYLAARHLEESRIPDESYRIFGPGSLSSIRWRSSDSLYYLRDFRVSLVRSSELLTRSFYSDPLPAGVPAGRLPVIFDSQFDSFWPAPDGRSILILKSDRNLFKFPLAAENPMTGESLPFLMLPEYSTVQQIWWRNNDDIFVLTGSGGRSNVPSELYLLNSSIPGLNQFRASGIDGIRRFAPSPDRQKLATLHKDEVSVRDSGNLEEIHNIPYSDPRDIFWVDSERLLVVGAGVSEIIPLDGRSRTTVTLSTADEAGFGSSGNVTAIVGVDTFSKETGSSHWIPAIGRLTSGGLNSSFDSPGHRVYVENLIKVRRVDGFGNRDLFSVPALRPDVISVESNAIGDSRVLEHGNRNGSREVSLVFNAIDTAEGLGEILTLLTDYDLSVTFFVGGDFIRSQPEAARLIAVSGHEIGSLFYTHMDMTDSRYNIDKDFVIRGLGRNEDEFFHTTGTEVSTIWHAPWYVISPSILDATEEMGYQYIGRDVDPLDWVVSDGLSGIRALYQPSAELVEMTLEMKKSGSIIPVRVGKPGIRGDYFFRSLELLINGLLNDGYDIVPVSELRKGLQ